MSNCWQLCISIFVNISFINWLIEWLGKIWYAIITFNEFNCYSDLILTSDQVFILLWHDKEGINWSHSGFRERLFNPTASAPPEDIGMLLTISYVMCDTGGGESPWEANQVIKQAVISPYESGTRNQFYVGFYHFYNWDSRGFFKYHPWLHAGLFLKKSACCIFSTIQFNYLGLKVNRNDIGSSWLVTKGSLSSELYTKKDKYGFLIIRCGEKLLDSPSLP